MFSGILSPVEPETQAAMPLKQPTVAKCPAPTFSMHFPQTMESGLAIASRECEVVRDDGANRPAVLRGVPILHHSGEKTPGDSERQTKNLKVQFNIDNVFYKY